MLPISPKTRPLLLLLAMLVVVAQLSVVSDAADSPPTEVVCDVCGNWEPIISHDIPGVDCDAIIEQGFAKELTFAQCDYYQTSIREICCRLPPTTAAPVAPTRAPAPRTASLAPTTSTSLPMTKDSITTTPMVENIQNRASFRIGMIVGSIASCCLLLTAVGGLYVTRRRRREQAGDGLRKFDVELAPTTTTSKPPPTATIATITTTTVARLTGDEQKEEEEQKEEQKELV